MRKEILADYSIKLAEIAVDICRQLNKSEVALKEKYFLGLLARQSIILKDVAHILLNRDDRFQMSTFILLRSLIDDFITVLYFESRNFSESDFIEHTANAYHKKYSMIKDSVNINEKYFNGENEDLANQAFYDADFNDFCNEEENHIYFKDIKKWVWKSFPQTSLIVRQLPYNGLAKANAHALIIWQLLSNYVHYSSFTELLENTPESRKIEMKQLQEVLSYVCKTIIISSSALSKFGLRNKIRDSTGVIDSVMEGYKDEDVFNPNS